MQTIAFQSVGWNPRSSHLDSSAAKMNSLPEEIYVANWNGNGNISLVM